MPDFTELDEQRINVVSKSLVEYLEFLGKTDLVKFSNQEWDELVRVAYHNSRVPF